MSKDIEALIERLEKRATEDESCVENANAVIAALADEMARFEARTGHNVYAVRLAVDHQSSARKDAQYAADLRTAIAPLRSLNQEESRSEESKNGDI